MVLPIGAFPTEKRGRQKVMQAVRKLAGGKATIRNYKIEEHYNDCGNDLPGLGPHVDLFAANIFIGLPAVDHDSAPTGSAGESFSEYWYRGFEGLGIEPCDLSPLRSRRPLRAGDVHQHVGQ